MENYKVFAKNPLIGIEDIIINRAIPIALKESFKARRRQGQVLKYNKRDSRIIGMHILQCVE